MPVVKGEIVIRRRSEEVFDVVADERNEPRYNRSMVSAELASPEPIGAGTRSRALIRNGRLTVEVEIELTQFERPRRLGSRSRSSVRLFRPVPILDSEGTLTFDSVPEGTRMRWSWRLRAHGPLRLLPGVVARNGARQERAIWGGLKELLEREQPAGEAQAG